MADISKVLVGESEHDIKDTTARAVMTGATSSTAGTAGRVPAPSAGDNEKFLRGDGTWHDVDTAPTYTFDTVAEMNAAIQAGTVPANGAVVYCKEDLPMGNTGDTTLNPSSTNWVQNQAVANAVNGKTDSGIIATVDNSSTATKAYVKAEYIYHDGVLYKAKSAIAQGDTFVTSGEMANLMEAVVGDDLFAATINIAPIETSIFTSQSYSAGRYLWCNGTLYKTKKYLSSGTRIDYSENTEAVTIGDELVSLNTSLANKDLYYTQTCTVQSTEGAIVTVSDAAITTNHVVTSCDFSDSTKARKTQWTTNNGSVVISGICSDASVTAYITLAKKDN